MPLWNKNGVDSKPKYVSKEDRKNVVATDKGWVRKVQYTGTGGISRVKEEILVTTRNLANLTSMGNPDITDIYVANSSGGNSLKVDDVNKVYVVYSEPVSIQSGASALTLAVANTAGGEAATATSNTSKASIINANNTLTFQFSVSTAGTYKIEAQDLTSNGSSKVYSLYGGTSEIANTNVSASVSNALATFLIS